MRLIDADRLLDRCKFYHLPNGDLAVPIIDVQHAPTVEPERKTGHWVKSDMQRWYDVWLCSECGEKTDSAVMSKPRYKYCPMCGADMRGEQE